MRNFCISFFIIFLFVSSMSFGQNCTKKSICNEILLGDDFDYRGQSSFFKLAPGDTSRIKVVLYSNNIARIVTCADEKLGDVQFKIIKTTRNYNRIIENINNTDTIWRTERLFTEETIFDSNNNNYNLFYFEKKIVKTKSVIIEVSIPLNENSSIKEGCVAVMIGRKLDVDNSNDTASQK